MGSVARYRRYTAVGARPSGRDRHARTCEALFRGQARDRRLTGADATVHGGMSVLSGDGPDHAFISAVAPSRAESGTTSFHSEEASGRGARSERKDGDERRSFTTWLADRPDLGRPADLLQLETAPKSKSSSIRKVLRKAASARQDQRRTAKVGVRGSEARPRSPEEKAATLSAGRDAAAIFLPSTTVASAPRQGHTAGPLG
ncbi:hypothetical protein MTO96_006914 [Rhipicephalus appendiculatus]